MFDLESTILEIFPGFFKSRSGYRGPGPNFKSPRHPETIRLFSLTSWVDWCKYFSDLTFLSQVTAKDWKRQKAWILLGQTLEKVHSAHKIRSISFWKFSFIYNKRFIEEDTNFFLFFPCFLILFLRKTDVFFQLMSQCLFLGAHLVNENFLCKSMTLQLVYCCYEKALWCYFNLIITYFVRAHFLTLTFSFCERLYVQHFNYIYSFPRCAK